MKKMKLMLGVVTLSIALLGTGYAAMADTLSINGTVSTANFNVDFIEDMNLVTDISENPDEAIMKQPNVIDNDTGDIVEFQEINLRPGESVTYEATMKNMSSIDAILKSIEVVELEQATIGSRNINECIELKITLTNSNISKTITGTLQDLSQASNMTDVILQEQGIVNEDIVKLQITIGLPDIQYSLDEAGTTKHIGFKLLFNWEQTQGNEIMR